jgi:hypothetical protein
VQGKSPWLVRVLWLYSAWFRYGGLAFALLSALFLIMMGFNIVSDWNGAAGEFSSGRWRGLALAFGPPLAGVIVGLALYKLVPKVELPRRKPEEG